MPSQPYNTLLGTLLLSLASTVQSFLAVHDGCKQLTTCRLIMQKASTKLETPGNPLYLLHGLPIESLHPHNRDSIVRLDDPIKLEEVNEVEKKNKALHHFTNHLAPVVLALYMVGHYLSLLQSSTAGSMNGGSTGIDIDPLFGGYVLIGTGLFMVKWSIDDAFLSPA